MEKKEQQQNGNNVNTPTAQGPLDIIYYTDPLCCWSWAFEPVWQQLKAACAPFAGFRYCMGGLLAEWNNFHDTVNAVSKPIQMGPVWLETAHLCGRPVNSRIWFDDPPASSYPACVAVKAAAMQSPVAEELYLLQLRTAVMTGGKNIARREILLEQAKELAATHPGIFSYQQFCTDLVSEPALQAFKADLQEVSYRNITRFPAIVVISTEGKGLLMVGNRPFDAIMAAIKELYTLPAAYV